ncbi:MAG: guanylate kinase [Alphaproteobacteria bacterium]|nr:guanylate kinase [Alphaproteobacteria bacterium]
MDGTVAIPRRGLMFVMSSPSGAGKTTISRRLLSLEPDLAMSISVTTRPPRPREVDGQDYFFIDRARYDAMVAGGEMLEHAEVFGNCYGTPRGPVEKRLAEGHDVLFDIDWQGTRQVKARMRDDVVSVFILPPSIGDLEKRLRSRAQDSDDVVKARMAKALDEVAHWDEYDYVVVNDDLTRCLDKVRSILVAERARRARQPGLEAFVGGLRG